MTDRMRKILWHLLRLLLVAALVAYVLSRSNLGDVSALARRFADRWPWAVAAVVVAMVQSPLGAIRWKLLLAVQDIRITFLESLRLTYIGWFFSNWMPGSTGGDFIKAYYIARQTHRKAEAVTVVFLDRLIGLIAMCMLGAAAVAVSFSDERVRLAQIIVAAFLAAVAGAAGVFYSGRLRSWLHVGRLVDRLPVRETVRRVERALFIYRYHKAKVLVTIVYSWGAQAASVVVMWLIGIGLGAGAAWYHYFVSMPVIWIGWSLVPVPGGLGVAETLMQQFFGSAVLSGAAPLTSAEAATMALTMMLAYRLAMLLASLPGGVLYLLQRTHVSPQQMRQEMARTPETPSP